MIFLILSDNFAEEGFEQRIDVQESFTELSCLEADVKCDYFTNENLTWWEQTNLKQISSLFGWYRHLDTCKKRNIQGMQSITISNFRCYQCIRFFTCSHEADFHALGCWKWTLSIQNIDTEYAYVIRASIWCESSPSEKAFSSYCIYNHHSLLICDWFHADYRTKFDCFTEPKQNQHGYWSPQRESEAFVLPVSIMKSPPG